MSNTISARKFYETTITIRVLSEEPFEFNDLDDIHYAIDQGDCVGHVAEDGAKTLDAKETVALLYEFGSEPGFFQLTDDAQDVPD